MTIEAIIRTFTGRVLEVTDGVHERGFVDRERTLYFIDEIVSIKQVNGTWEKSSDAREAVFDITFRYQSKKLRVRSRLFEHLRRYKEANEFIQTNNYPEEYHDIHVELFPKLHQSSPKDEKSQSIQG